MIRRWLSIILVLAMLASVLPAQTIAAELVAQEELGIVDTVGDVYTPGDLNEPPEILTDVRSICADVLPEPCVEENIWIDLDVLDLSEAIFLATKEAGTLDLANDPYVSVEEAGAQVREAMKRRESTVTVYFYTDESDHQTACYAAFYEAMEHTGDPTAGDYLRRQWGRCSASLRSFGATAAGWKIGITYNIDYHTTAAQEAELDVAVEALLSDLNLEGLDDYTKFITVYRYMCDHITYDYDNLNDDTYTLKYTAYAAMMHKTAVCQGYALLLYRLMLELGVDCRYISGYGDGGRHGWNIVQIDGKYYNADATWDAGETEFDWCLLNQANFTLHTRNEEYDTAEFHQRYPMGATNYVYSPKTVASGTCGANVTWKLKGDGTLTISGTGAMDNYAFAPVATTPWYQQRATVRKVIIEEGVTSIGASAFYGCKNMTGIFFPESVTGIGERAFYDCADLTEVYYAGTNAQWNEISVGSENTAFLKVFVYYEGWGVAYLSFQYNSVDESYAIVDCDPAATGKMVIPSVYKQKPVTEITSKAFASCTGLTSVVVPDSVISIGYGAFTSCSNLTSVTISNGVSYIGEAAFWKCGRLTNIVIPGSVISVDSYAFCECTSLESAVILNGVTSVGKYAFNSCTNLKSVVLPSSVTEINVGAFYNCTNLRTVIYCGTSAQWNAVSIKSSNTNLRNASVQYHSITDGACRYCEYALTYTVTFKNWDGTVLSAKTYHYGDKVIEPADPSRSSDNTYTYAFAGWDKAVAAACKADATYTATYKATYIDYTVTFKNWDGTMLSTKSYHYGDKVTAPATPSRPGDDTYVYIFTGWDKTVVNCVGNAVYTAVYSSKLRVPSTITSVIYAVSGGIISNIAVETTVSTALSKLGEGEYVKVYNGDQEVTGNSLIGTGMVLKIMDGNTVKVSVTAVVTGDTNGDGKITVTDMLAVKSHVLKKSTLGGTAGQAGDTNGDNAITITDFLQLKAHILGKSNVTPRIAAAS